MPREVIRPSNPRADGEVRFQAAVGWSRDMDVQLGIETEDDRHLVDYIYADDQERIAHLLVERLQQSGFKIAPREGTPAGEELEADTLGRFILDAVTGSTPFGTSVWWRPDRRQINDLIRLLRRARDAAFGRDE